MNIRFFILQAHYRSTLDFSNEALQAAEKGFQRLMKAIALLKTITPAEKSSFNPDSIILSCYEALHDDLNTPVALAQVFEAARLINTVADRQESLSSADQKKLLEFMETVMFSILGLVSEDAVKNDSSHESELIDLIVKLRLDARKKKDFTTSDIIRDQLSSLGITLKDTKDGTTWEID
jgi:cysteinyl-tRNA synthetase